jgi:hypothetical protein
LELFELECFVKLVEESDMSLNHYVLELEQSLDRMAFPASLQCARLYLTEAHLEPLDGSQTPHCSREIHIHPQAAKWIFVKDPDTESAACTRLQGVRYKPVFQQIA